MKILAIAMICMIPIGVLATVPMAAANEEFGSNEPMTDTLNKLYLYATDSSDTTYVGFLSPDPADKDNLYGATGVSVQGTYMSNVMPSETEYTYTPVPGYSVEMGSADSKAHIVIMPFGFSLPIIGELPIPGVGQIEMSISISYAGTELASQDVSQMVSGENFAVDFTFKMPSGNISFGNGSELSILVSYNGGYGLAGAGVRYRGESYVEFPILKKEVPIEDNVTIDDGTGNETAGQNETNAPPNEQNQEKTPGFEFLGLACAVSVAVFLIRRKH